MDPLTDPIATCDAGRGRHTSTGDGDVEGATVTATAAGGAGGASDSAAASASASSSGATQLQLQLQLQLPGRMMCTESAEPLHLHLEPHRASIPRCCAASAVLRRRWRWQVPSLPRVDHHDHRDVLAAATASASASASAVSSTRSSGSKSLQRRLDSTCATQTWIGVDPWAPRRDLERRFPLYTRYASSATVHVRAGEVLYLPALWYHQVSQTCYTVAVNMWHDADFCGPAWAYYSMCKAVAPAVQASWAPEDAD